MAKKSMIARDVKRVKIALKYANKRTNYLSVIKNRNASFEETRAAVFALQKMPRDSSLSRQQKRCRVTGRPRGVYKKFGLSRNKLRELVMWGKVPGVYKTSW